VKCQKKVGGYFFNSEPKILAVISSLGTTFNNPFDLVRSGQVRSSIPKITFPSFKKWW